MSLRPAGRKLLLAVHLTCSVGWIGAVCAYLALGFAIPATDDPGTVRAAWIAMEISGWWAIVPLSALSLVTGVFVALASPWGLFRHYWVLVSFSGTVVLNAVLLLHMPDVSHQADAARAATDRELLDLGSDLTHALIGLVLLIGILVLNIYKPRGLTTYGWRRQQAARTRTADRPSSTD